MIKVLFILSILLTLFGIAHADIYKYINEEGVIVYTDLPTDQEAFVVVKSDKKPFQFQKKWNSLYESIKKYYPIVKRKADEFLVDPELIKAMITVESNWSPLAVSPKGAMGLMQLMPLTARSVSVNNPFDPEQNITGGIKYFRMLLDEFKGNLRKALAAYNAGPRRVKSKTYFPHGSETRSYVDKILSLYGGEENFKYIPVRKRLYEDSIYKLVLEDGTILFTDTPLIAQDENL